MGMHARYPIAILGMVVVCLTTVAVPKQVLAAPEDTQANVTKRLERFDQLDFDAFSKQDWKRFNEIHCPDVVVTFPDGHQTHGIKKHTEDMIAMFVPMPDLRITEHSVSFGSDVWARSTLTGVRPLSHSPLANGLPL